jgi:hypothetical protein
LILSHLAIKMTSMWSRRRARKTRWKKNLVEQFVQFVQFVQRIFQFWQERNRVVYYVVSVTRRFEVDVRLEIDIRSSTKFSTIVENVVRKEKTIDF